MISYPLSFICLKKNFAWLFHALTRLHKIVALVRYLRQMIDVIRDSDCIGGK